MPSELEEFADGGLAAWNLFSVYINTIRGLFTDLGDSILSNNWGQCHTICDNINVYLDYARDALTSGVDCVKYQWHSAFMWINDNWGGTITMDMILQAIWDSDSLRWFHFINYIDAMRAGIWNKEIMATHLTNWYIHFSQQSS